MDLFAPSGRGEGHDRIVPDVPDSESLGGHGPDVDPGPLIHVGADMEPHRPRDRVLASLAGEATREKVEPVELRVAGNPVHLVDELAHLDLNLHPVLGAINAVRGLDRQLAETLDDVLRLLEVTFRRLDERMPSCAFFEARFRPRICDRIFSETARPEASSPARLIRIPDESFSVSFWTSRFVTPRERLANMALRL